jgi:TrmH family RNA methyltransferase
METIISKDNSRFKVAKSLLLRKHRENQGLCIVEGVRLVTHIQKHHPERIQTVFIDALCAEQYGESFRNAIILHENLFKDLSDTVHSQGLIALVKTDQVENQNPSHLMLALDGIQDPGNLGTVIRTCDAVGHVDLMLSKGCVDIYNPKVLRSAMGSLFDVRIVRNCQLEIELLKMKALGYTIVGAALEGAENLLEFKWKHKTILIIGNEGNGISQDILDLCDQRVKIPLSGHAESLNAAVAAGILLYDAHRNLVV